MRPGVRFPKSDYCVTHAPDARGTATLNGVIVNGLARPRGAGYVSPRFAQRQVTCFGDVFANRGAVGVSGRRSTCVYRRLNREQKS
jgi:hypothetical protein